MGRLHGEKLQNAKGKNGRKHVFFFHVEIVVSICYSSAVATPGVKL